MATTTYNKKLISNRIVEKFFKKLNQLLHRTRISSVGNTNNDDLGRELSSKLLLEQMAKEEFAKHDSKRYRYYQYSSVIK